MVKKKEKISFKISQHCNTNIVLIVGLYFCHLKLFLWHNLPRSTKEGYVMNNTKILYDIALLPEQFA